MIRGRGALAVLCAIAMLAAACGNSPSGDGAAPSADTVAPTTAAPTADESAAEPEPAEPDEPAPEPEPAETDEPAPEPAEPEPAAPDTPDEAPEPEPAPADEEDEPTAAEPEEPVVEEPVDPYPQRHEFVALEGVPGVTDEEIRVNVIGTRSNNPLGTCILDCFVTGIQAYFDYVNDAGGVYGRKLVIGEELDDELGLQPGPRPSRSSPTTTPWPRSRPPWPSPSAGATSTTPASPPSCGTSTAPRRSTATPFSASFVIGCPTCTSRGLPWLVAQAGGSRVAFLGYGVSAGSQVCAKAFADSVELYSADLGLEVAYLKDDLAYGLPNGVGPEVTQMADAGVDFIISCLDLNAMLTVAQELERQGVRDQIKMLHPNSYDADFVAAAGSLFDGDYVLVLFAGFEYDVDSDLRDAYHQWVPAHGGPVAEQTMVGWINADLFVTGLLEAGPSFSRQAIIDSLNQITYGADGLINPIDWRRQHNPVTEGDPANDYELECVSYVRMEGGAFVGFQPAPWMCWSNADLSWYEPVPTNF